MNERRFQVTIPDLTWREAIDLVEQVGGGSVAFADHRGKPYDPLRPFRKLSAYPRQNEATIELMQPTGEE